MSVKRKAKGAARKSSPSSIRPSLKLDDWITITDISSDLKDGEFDLKDPEHVEMRTGELFRFCLGRTFQVQGFDRYGFVALDVSKDRAVRRKFGKWHTIWMEPEFLRRVRKPTTKKRE